MRISDWSSDVCSSDLAVADGDEDVAQEAVAAGALDGRAGEDAAEARVVELGEILQAWCGQLGARQERRLRRALRKLVPRADGEAVVAAVDAVAHGRAQRARNVPHVLDGEGGDAASGAEPVRAEEGMRRTEGQATPAKT